MPNFPQAFQVVAVDATGQPTSVDMVPRGDACGCSCISCGAALTARQGEQRNWHFAHRGAECGVTRESILHWTAKQILREHRKVLLPPLSGPAVSPGGVPAGELVSLDKIQLEAVLGGIRADVLALQGTVQLALEIKVSHGVDALKTAELERLQLRCVEIVLDAGAPWTLESLAAMVVHEPANRIWRFHPDIAAQAMLSRTQAEEGETAGAKKLVKLRLDGIPVNVTRYSWGVIIWAPYNEENNQTIKSIANRHRGYWNGKRRNWVIPGDSFAQIIAALEALGAVARQQFMGCRRD